MNDLDDTDRRLIAATQAGMPLVPRPYEAVAAVLGEQCPIPMRRVGVKDVFGHSGPAWELLEQFGLRSDAIIAAVKELV